MNSKVNSLEEKVKLPPTETISRCYQPQQGNRKVIRILTVAVYVLCVSLAAIMLSLYYIFIWDPTIRPFVNKGNNCDKLVIPEKIAIRLLNSSEVTAEQFYKHILEQYRILNQLQQQRQQFLQKQHIQLQQLAAGNRFQEIFATATIIQSNPNDPIKKPITPTNGTFLLEPPPPRSVTVDLLNGGGQVPILDTAPVMTHLTPKRKQHRKHYAGGHHRRMQKGGHKKPPAAAVGAAATAAAAESGASDGGSSTAGAAFLTPAETSIVETPLNPPTSVMQEPFVYTSMPIPLILNSGEDKRPPHHAHAHAHAHGEHRGGLGVGGAQARKRTTSATVAGYDAHSYLNPFLTGELIFEK